MKIRFINNSGASLIMAIIFASALMLVTAGLAEISIRAIQDARNYNTSGNVELLANSALEQAESWIAEHAMGANINSADLAAGSADYESYIAPLIDSAADVGVSDCAATPCAGFEVKGRSTADSDTVSLSGLHYYSVPVKTTGTGSSTCVDANDADDPCNWNQLRFGNSVEIPLYYEDAGGGVHKLETGSDFLLRVRTPPCTGTGVDCASNERTILYPKIPSDYACSTCPFGQQDRQKDPVLIQWLISDAEDGSTLMANDNTAAPGDRETDKRNADISIADDYRYYNTEISGGRINDANPSLSPDIFHLDNFIVLENRGAVHHKGIKVHDKSSQIISGFINDSSKPTLRLSLVSHPRKNIFLFATSSMNNEQFNDTQNDMQYLEYQVLTSSPNVSDSKSEVKAWAQIGDFRKEITKNIERPAALGGFALESF